MGEVVKENLLPTITEATCETLVGIIEPDKGELEEMRLRLTQFTEGVIIDLIEANRTLAQNINLTLKSFLITNAAGLIDSYLAGLVTVLKAFDIQSPYLIARLSQLNQSQINKIVADLKETFSPVETDTLEKRLRSPTIPPTQSYLNLALSKIQRISVFPTTFRDGAAAMYHVLWQNWVTISALPTPQK